MLSSCQGGPEPQASGGLPRKRWSVPAFGSSVMPSDALLQRMRAAEGVHLHAGVVNAHRARHGARVAVKVGERADQLRHHTDIGHRELIAVAIAARLAVVGKMALDRFQGAHGPVREPAVARRLVLAHLLLEVIADPRRYQ